MKKCSVQKISLPFGQVRTKMYLSKSPFSKTSHAGAIRQLLISVPAISLLVVQGGVSFGEKFSAFTSDTDIMWNYFLMKAEGLWRGRDVWLSVSILRDMDVLPRSLSATN